MNRRWTLNELPEWRIIRRVLSEKTDLTQNQLIDLAETEVDSLDVVELVMSIEETYGTKLRLD